MGCFPDNGVGECGGSFGDDVSGFRFMSGGGGGGGGGWW